MVLLIASFCSEWPRACLGHISPMWLECQKLSSLAEAQHASALQPAAPNMDLVWDLKPGARPGCVGTTLTGRYMLLGCTMHESGMSVQSVCQISQQTNLDRQTDRQTEWFRRSECFDAPPHLTRACSHGVCSHPRPAGQSLRYTLQ